MDLKDKINYDLKDALKAGDKLRLKTVRSIRALILEFEKSGTNKEFNEEEEIKLLSSAAKKRRESIEEYRKAGATHFMFNFPREQLLEDLRFFAKKVITYFN